MKKLFPVIFAISMALVSCGPTQYAKLMNSAAYSEGKATFVVTPLCADLKVDGKKISYFMPVSQPVAAGGLQNVINTAVKEALEQNGYADAMVGLQTQVKYTEYGAIESIAITGYPARYINFRNAPEGTVVPVTVPEETTSGFSLFKKK